jgi:hypothetical protein
MAACDAPSRRWLLRPNALSAKTTDKADDAEHHKLRKYRSQVKKSKAGKAQKVKLPNGDHKLVPHEYFFTMYNAKGEDIGQHWMRKMRPTDQEKKEYKAHYGHDHPITLPVKKN